MGKKAAAHQGTAQEVGKSVFLIESIADENAYFSNVYYEPNEVTRDRKSATHFYGTIENKEILDKTDKIIEIFKKVSSPIH